jgi:hypothetical protein
MVTKAGPHRSPSLQFHFQFRRDEPTFKGERERERERESSLAVAVVLVVRVVVGAVGVVIRVALGAVRGRE